MKTRDEHTAASELAIKLRAMHDYPGSALQTVICRENDGLYLREGLAPSDTVLAHVPVGLSADDIADWIDDGMPSDD